MDFKGADILSTGQFSQEDILRVLKLAAKLDKAWAEGKSLDHLLHGKLMATIFFEPSTRTRFSHETAMLRLGGSVMSNPDMLSLSSYKKQETLHDTGKMVGTFADVVVMRHPEAHSVEKLAAGTNTPVINAGDGPNEHPTQGLLDLYTIWKNKGHLFDGLNIGMVGDLKYGRVPHSQCDLLKHFDVRFTFVAPQGLAMPREIVEELKRAGREVIETENFDEAIADMDVISMTRVQEERFIDKNEYLKYKGVYILDSALMEKAKKEAIVLHPLPRVDEITAEIDLDPRAKYFEQVHNGVVVRMALLLLILGKDSEVNF